MSNVVYPLILFLMIFGAGMTYINETGLYAVKMHESGISSELEQAQSTSVALTESSKSSGLNAIETLALMGKVAFGAVASVFTLGFLLQSFGIDAGLATFLISPLPIVVIFWLIEFWTGRAAE